MNDDDDEKHGVFRWEMWDINTSMSSLLDLSFGLAYEG